MLTSEAGTEGRRRQEEQGFKEPRREGSEGVQGVVLPYPGENPHGHPGSGGMGPKSRGQTGNFSGTQLSTVQSLSVRTRFLNYAVKSMMRKREN